MKIDFLFWLKNKFKEFISESKTKKKYEVVELFECHKTGLSKAIIKLSARHAIEKSISSIIADNFFIDNLDNKTIRTLVYMATIEKLKPDYSIIVQRLDNEINDYILEVKSNKDNVIIRKSSRELTKDKSLLTKFSSIDANRIGYLAGAQETVKEYILKYNQKIKE